MVVIRNISGVEVEPDVRMVHRRHQGQHGLGVLSRALVGLEGQRDSVLTGDIAKPAQVLHHGAVFSFVRRLACAGHADRDAKPAGGEADSPLGQLEALPGANIGATDIAAADLDPVSRQVVAKRLSHSGVGLLRDHRGLGDHQTAQVVSAESQLEVLDACLPDALDGRPDAGSTIAIRETTDDSFHVI